MPSIQGTAEEYGKIVNIPLDQDAFAAQARKWLENKAAKADRSFPDNALVRFEQGLPVVRKAQRRPDTRGTRDLKEAIASRLKPVTILDVLLCALKWVEWDKGFGPQSGFDSKLEDPALNYLLTLFCYGCNLGPSQTAKSVKGITRHQLAWINQRHITEEKLNEAIVKLFNAYAKFICPDSGDRGNRKKNMGLVSVWFGLRWRSRGRGRWRERERGEGQANVLPS